MTIPKIHRTLVLKCLSHLLNTRLLARYAAQIARAELGVKYESTDM